GEDREVLDQNGDLATFGAAKRAVDTNEIAQIELAHQIPLLVGEVAPRKEQLDLAGRIMNVKKPQFACLPPQHDAASDADRLAVDTAFLRATGADFGNGGVTV